MLRRLLITGVCINILMMLTIHDVQSEQASPGKGVIVLADISGEPAKKLKRFQPLADYLAARLNDFDIGFWRGESRPRHRDADAVDGIRESGSLL